LNFEEHAAITAEFLKMEGPLTAFAKKILPFSSAIASTFITPSNLSRRAIVGNAGIGSETTHPCQQKDSGVRSPVFRARYISLKTLLFSSVSAKYFFTDALSLSEQAYRVSCWQSTFEGISNKINGINIFIGSLDKIIGKLFHLSEITDRYAGSLTVKEA
jgi:hypothetical protein